MVLQRARPELVCIWIACSRPFQITAEIFQFEFLFQKEADQYEQKAGIKQADNNPKKGAPVIGRGTANSMRLGENLHIALVVAHPLLPGKADMKDETGASDYTTDINIGPVALSIKKNGYPTDELLAYDIGIALQTTICLGTLLKSGMKV